MNITIYLNHTVHNTFSLANLTNYRFYCKAKAINEISHRNVAKDDDNTQHYHFNRQKE